MPRKRATPQIDQPPADLILTSDWHLREDQPLAWEHSYWDAQQVSMTWLQDLQNHHGCPVVVAGDIFDKWKPSPWLLSWALENIPLPTYAIPGQHDLPQHSMSRIDESGIYTIKSGNGLSLLPIEPACTRLTPSKTPVYLYGYPFGTPATSLATRTRDGGCHIAAIHQLTYTRRKPYPGCTADNATKLLTKMAGYDVVITGDNHQGFAIQGDDGRWLVNPGSWMRMTAGQIDYEPRIYLWYHKGNKVVPVNIPQVPGAVSREHIDSETAQAARDGRIDAYVERLGDEIEIGLSFLNNLRATVDKGKVRAPVQNLLWEAVDEHTD